MASLNVLDDASSKRANDQEPTQDQRATVVAWLKGRREIARFDVETLD